MTYHRAHNWLALLSKALVSPMPKTTATKFQKPSHYPIFLLHQMSQSVEVPLLSDPSVYRKVNTPAYLLLVVAFSTSLWYHYTPTITRLSSYLQRVETEDFELWQYNARMIMTHDAVLHSQDDRVCTAGPGRVEDGSTATNPIVPREIWHTKIFWMRKAIDGEIVLVE